MTVAPHVIGPTGAHSNRFLLIPKVLDRSLVTPSRAIGTKVRAVPHSSLVKMCRSRTADSAHAGGHPGSELTETKLPYRGACAHAAPSNVSASSLIPTASVSAVAGYRSAPE